MMLKCEKNCRVILICFISGFLFITVSQENNEEFFEDISKQSDNTYNNIKKFASGSVRMNAGFMYASSLLGADFEFGITKIVGFQIGIGFIGAATGLNFHLMTKDKIDLFLSANGNFMPGLQTVIPAIDFNIRKFSGGAKKAGFCAKVGMGVCTVDKTITLGSKEIVYKNGMPMLTYAVGVAVKIKQ